jgi:hypothetical protein
MTHTLQLGSVTIDYILVFFIPYSVEIDRGMKRALVYCIARDEHMYVKEMKANTTLHNIIQIVFSVFNTVFSLQSCSSLGQL